MQSRTQGAYSLLHPTGDKETRPNTTLIGYMGGDFRGDLGAGKELFVKMVAAVEGAPGGDSVDGVADGEDSGGGHQERSGVDPAHAVESAPGAPVEQIEAHPGGDACESG